MFLFTSEPGMIRSLQHGLETTLFGLGLVVVGLGVSVS